MSQRIGQYEVIEQIGAGGMATVYKAYQAKLDRNVAIKVMHQMFADDVDFTARFEREARIVARLDHPHIVPIYDYDQQDRQPYLVMKYLQGETLKAVLADGTLPLEDIRRMMRQIADALTYAHQQGILHRDIKPSNIIVDTSGQPYLTDFGLARLAAQGESTMSVDTMLGTPQYISPEQAQGLPDISPATDVYSLACILYQLVVGQVPFTGDTPYAIVHKHIYAAPTPPSELNPEVPPQVDAVLLKALDKDPDSRYATPNELVDAFEQAIATSGLKALDESRVELAQARAEDVSHHTPAGGKYVSIPAPPPGAGYQPSSLNAFVQDIGDRFRGAFEDIRRDVQKGDVIQSLADNIREVAYDVQDAITSSSAAKRLGVKPDEHNEHNEARVQSGSRTGVPIVVVRPGQSSAVKLIEADWGTDDRSIRGRVNKRMRDRQLFFIHLVLYTLAIAASFVIQPGVQSALAAQFTDAAFVEATGVNFLEPIASINFALVSALLWGAALLEHGLNVYYRSGQHLARRRRALQNELEVYYGDDWQTTVTAQQYKRTRRRVYKRFNERTRFIGHGIWFVMISLAILALWPPLYDVLTQIPVEDAPGLQAFLNNDVLIPAMAILILALTVLGHGLVLAGMVLFGQGADANTIKREIELERELSGIGPSYEKRKNDPDDPFDRMMMDAEDKQKRQYKNENPAPPAVRLTQDGEFTESFVTEMEQSEMEQSENEAGDQRTR